MTKAPVKPADDRAARLAEALRVNLHRRKAQARAAREAEDGTRAARETEDGSGTTPGAIGPERDQ